MIDFRYHVVSIIAVFLALTVGLVLGASFLSSAQIDILKGQITSANNAKSGLESDNRTLMNNEKQLQDYIDETKENLVDNQLYNDYVVIVRAAGSDDGSTDAVLALAKRASATITADITINAAFADPGSTDQLANLLLEYAPTGQPLAGADTVGEAMNLLAEALTAQATAGTGAKPPTAPPATMTAAWSVVTLKAFRELGVITINTMPTAATMTKPTAAFIAAPGKAATDAQNAPYVALAQTLHAAGVGAVIGGTAVAAGSGGVIAAVLKSASASRSVSTVDNMNETTGQVAVVFVLYQEGANPQAAAGHYGTTGSTDGLLPKLPSLPAIPTPSAG